MPEPLSIKNILLTGRPRVGKSTLILRIVERLKRAGVDDIGGFYTLEASEAGKRIGFDINTLDGRRGRLARVGIESRFRLGKYGIDMVQLEEIALSALSKAIEHDDIIVIDEIGFMELKSRRFQELVEKALDSPKPVIATIMKNSFEFPDRIKAREDVRLVTVRADNRDKLEDEVGEMILRLRAKEFI